MIRKLMLVKKYKEHHFWVLDNKTLGVSFELSLFDRDQTGERPYLDLSHWLRSIKGLNIRWSFYGQHDNFESTDHKRSEDLREYGSKRFTLYVHFELEEKIKTLSSMESSIDKIINLLPIEGLIRMGFSTRNLTPAEIPRFLVCPNKPISLMGTHLDAGDEYIAVIKLKEPKEIISSDVMDLICMELPCPFEIHVHVRVPDSAKVAMQFQLNVKRESNGGLFSSAKRLFSNREALEKIEMEGIAYHAFEWHLVLRGTHQEDLKLAAKHSFDVLSHHLGAVSLNSVGQFRALESTLLGGEFHSGDKFNFGGILETHNALPHFIPFNLRGTWRPQPLRHSLGLHRTNHTIDYLNIFDPSYKSYSAVIVGDTGLGKSVFISQLIRSLHYDTETKIIIIDVKGSNKRVVESLGGDIFNVNLNEESGFDPLSVLKVDSSEDTLNLLKEFIGSLCLEEAEGTLSEGLASIIGIALKEYARSFKKCNLVEFLSFLPKDFERISHIKRFTHGIESKVFQSRKDKLRGKIADEKSRLTYYFLEKIETATNRSLRKAMVNAVLMEFYLLLRTKRPEEKVVFICDEAPFFIQDAFSIFSTLIKTMRSLKGSLILAVQYSENLIAWHNRIQDESLINQSSIKILFNSDGDKDLFSSRFKLSEEEFLMLQQNQSKKGQFSQFFIKDTNGARMARLYLTDREFWESGTDGVEVAEIMNLKAIYPELNDREVALLLDLARARGELNKRKYAEENEDREATEYEGV